MKTLEKIREMKSKVKAELDEAAPKMRYALVGKDMKIYSMGSDERDLRLDRRSLERRFKNVAPLKMARLKTAQALGDKVDKSQIKEEVETVDEAKLTPQQRDRLDDLILMVHMTVDPEYYGKETPDKYLKAIEKEFGSKVAKQVKDGMHSVHWGRDNHSSGNDKLSWRKGKSRITKSGKMNKRDVEALKNRIKRDKQWGGITKKVKLPEEAKSVDVKTEKTSSADLAKAMAAFRAKGGKVKKVAPGKAQGAHGKDDLGTGMMGILNRGDTSRFKTKKRGKIKSMSAGTEVEVVNKSEADGK